MSIKGCCRCPSEPPTPLSSIILLWLFTISNRCVYHILQSWISADLCGLHRVLFIFILYSHCLCIAILYSFDEVKHDHAAGWVTAHTPHLVSFDIAISPWCICKSWFRCHGLRRALLFAPCQFQRPLLKTLHPTLTSTYWQVQNDLLRITTHM